MARANRFGCFRQQFAYWNLIFVRQMSGSRMQR